MLRMVALYRCECLLHSIQRLFDQHPKGRLVVHRHLSKNLAINLNIGNMNRVHQIAVAHAIHAGGSIDARNPQAAHIALAIFAVAIHIRHRAHDRFVRGTEETLTRATMALGHLQYLFMLLVGGYATLYSWHSLYFLSSRY